MLSLLKLFLSVLDSQRHWQLQLKFYGMEQVGRRGRNTTDWQRPPGLALFKERPAVFRNGNWCFFFPVSAFEIPAYCLSKFNGLLQVTHSTSLEERQNIASTCKILLLAGKLPSEIQVIVNFGTFSGWMIWLLLYLRDVAILTFIPKIHDSENGLRKVPHTTSCFLRNSSP